MESRLQMSSSRTCNRRTHHRSGLSLQGPGEAHIDATPVAESKIGVIAGIDERCVGRNQLLPAIAEVVEDLGRIDWTSPASGGPAPGPLSLCGRSRAPPWGPSRIEQAVRADRTARTAGHLIRIRSAAFEFMNHLTAGKPGCSQAARSRASTASNIVSDSRARRQCAARTGHFRGSRNASRWNSAPITGAGQWRRSRRLHSLGRAPACTVERAGRWLPKCSA